MGFSQEKRRAIEARVEHRIQLGHLSFAPVGVGNYATGNVLLLGEQASNPTQDTPNQQPFCGAKGCSGWLNYLLEEDKVPEERLFWLNVKNNDGTWIDPSVVLNMGADLVISLGKTAAQFCQQNGIKSTPQFHPQYWKRFHHKKRYPLLDLLRENILKQDRGLESAHR